MELKYLNVKPFSYFIFDVPFISIYYLNIYFRNMKKHIHFLSRYINWLITNKIMYKYIYIYIYLVII